MLTTISLTNIDITKVNADDGDSDYSWVISKPTSNFYGHIHDTYTMRLVNKTNTDRQIVAHATTKFYFYNTLIKSKYWEYTGTGAYGYKSGSSSWTGGEQIWKESDFCVDYNNAITPDLSYLNTNIANGQIVTIIWEAKSKYTTIEFSNTNTSTDETTFKSKPWVNSNTSNYYDTIAGWSYEINDNPNNYNISEMQKESYKRTCGYCGIEYYDSISKYIWPDVTVENAGKYLHVTVYTQNGAKIADVRKIPDVLYLSYDLDGGTGNIPTSSGTFTGNISVTNQKPTKTGYTFDAWYTGKNGTGKKYDGGDSIVISSNTTLYANYKPITYKVSYGKGYTNN
jgi:uncharacterized repeat protein (TIGR02543 family)